MREMRRFWCREQTFTTKPSVKAMEENEQWRKERIERCKDPSGWLTLAGLHWLSEGENTIGKDAGNSIVFETPSAPPKIGTISLKTDEAFQIKFTPAEDVEVEIDGEKVTSTVDILHDEQPNGPTTLVLGTLSWFIILRSGKFAIRLKDSASPVLTNFTGIDMYQIDLSWRLKAKFVPYDPPKILQAPNALGELENKTSPGYVEFKRGETTYKLDATGNPEQKLFLIFADATTNKETYGGGRYLYTGPVENGEVVVDFNQAYNPPCVFTDFATCTYAHKENRLTDLAITAGEKKFKSTAH